MEINLTLTKFQKEETTPETLIKEFEKILQPYPIHETIYTDGSKNNEAVGLAAVHIQKSKRITEDIQRLPKEASIFSAEIGALQESLTIIKDSTKTNFLILSDSLSCLQALKQLDPPDIRIMCLKLNIHNLIKEGYKLTFMWIPSHIGIQGNEIADSLAKEALNLQIDNRLTPKLPYSDFRPKIKEYTFSLEKRMEKRSTK